MQKVKIHFSLHAAEIPMEGFAWMVFDFIQLLMKPHLALFSRVYRGIIILECGDHMRE